VTSTDNLLDDLRAIVGRSHLITANRSTLRYRRGFRAAAGTALAVARPGSLVELWRVVKRLVAADVAIIVQAANTGLTGGSTPDARLTRPTVIINTMRLSGIHLINEGKQVISLPGATLAQLEDKLRPLRREPHSVIGSSCFGASVIGGICNNSGGSLIQRGPAYTELSLFARIDEGGALSLVNQLGIDLGVDDEDMLRRLEAGEFEAQPSNAPASAPNYAARVRAVDEATPARFNADPEHLHECSGSAGHLVVFAVRTDTFSQADGAATFYLGTNAPDELTRVRRVMLTELSRLPVSAEYMHRDAFDIADRYGRDTFFAIRTLGTKRLPALFALKARLDAVGEAVGIRALSDRLLQSISRLLPDHLPARMRQWRDRYEHHLILKVEGESLAEVRRLLTVHARTTSGAFFECDADEASRATLHRFVAAGAAIRYLAVNHQRLSGLVALDVALPRNARTWVGELRSELKGAIEVVLHYGHFFCHVFHRDYLVAAGADPGTIKAKLLAALDEEGAEYPAEHNVGRQYRAKPALHQFYRLLDPTNRFNPGVGLTPVGPGWNDNDEVGDAE
jgi:D-lactate dehydrogenase